MSVYFDIEGIPDRDFYYLIGILISDENGERYHSFWADCKEDEERIWRSFLNMIDSMDDFTLYHYGSYESVYLDRMQKKYGGADVIDKAKSSAVNVLSLIYAHVYFPTHSNGLKSIANYLGFQWSSPDASGIQSIVWRYSWERTKQDGFKQKRIDYNREDCLALQLVTESLRVLSSENREELSKFPSPILTTDEIKREYPLMFKANNFVLPDFDKINKRSYSDYQRSKVYLRTSPSARKSLKRKRRNEPSNDKMKALKVNKEILYQRPSKCKFCGQAKPWMNRTLSKTVYDLKLFKGGIKRWVVKHKSASYRCKKCKGFSVPDSYAMKKAGKYGRTLQAYIIYQVITYNQSISSVTIQLR